MNGGAAPAPTALQPAGTTVRRTNRIAVLASNRAMQDAFLAALIVLARIPANLGMPGAAAGLGFLGLYAILRIDQCMDVLKRCWLQLSYPFLALLSVTWAVHPLVTGRAAAQMTLTAFAGLLLSQAIRPRAVLTGLFIVFAGYTVGSLLAGQTRPDGITGVPALFGLGGEAKNYFADSSCTAVLLAIVMIAACLERRAIALAVGCVAIALACIVATERARSAGAVASLAIATALLLVLLALRTRSPVWKAGFAAALIAAFALCALLFQPLLALVQELSSKDAGLTGRGYLWFRAEYIIAERPWLGTGYYGFWTPSNPDAIGLWRYFDIRQEGTAFSFHNSYIQTMVETGYIGLIVLVGTWIAGAMALLRRFVLTPSLPTCFWLSYLTLQLSKSPVEPIRPAALVAPTVMLFAALGFGWFSVARRDASG